MNKAFFEKWSKVSGKSIKELQKIMEQASEDVEKLYTDKSGPEKERLTKALFGKTIRRLSFSKSKAENFFGFILGCDRKRDIAEGMRRKALAAYRADPTQAQLEGLVDENGVPLDPREKMGNRDNPNFHKPLIQHIWVRGVFGVAKKEGTKQPMLFKMTLWRGAANHFQYKPFIPLEFKAIMKNMQKGFYELNPSKLTKFQATRRTIDFEKWIRDAQGIKPLNELKAFGEAHRKDYDAYIFTEGDVDLINSQVNPNTESRSIVLSDADKGMIETVRVWIPADFPIGFSELSRVIVLGRVRLWKRENEDTERVSMNGYSIFPLPGQTIDMGQPIETQSAPSDDEGFVIDFIEEPEE